jgi:hypothetical protein
VTHTLLVTAAAALVAGLLVLGATHHPEPLTATAATTAPARQHEHAGAQDDDATTQWLAQLHTDPTPQTPKPVEGSDEWWDAALHNLTGDHERRAVRNLNRRLGAKIRRLPHGRDTLAEMGRHSHNDGQCQLARFWAEINSLTAEQPIYAGAGAR